MEELVMGKSERFYADVMAMHPEVTGSCNLVIVKLPNGETIRFVVDCGLFQEREYEELNSTLPFYPEKVEFAVVTHNHVDHTGRLPFMVKNGFDKALYTTKTTCQLLPLALYDSYKVLKDVAKRKNRSYLYSEADVEKTLSLLKPCQFAETIEVSQNVKITFLKNGHLIGAAMILVRISYPEFNDINLLFTGDYKSSNLFFDVDPVPEWILDLPLTVIQESTYGNMDTSQIHKCFKDNILDCISNSGTVVAPVFSLGRSQEILYELKCMQDEGVLSKEVPIYLDGSLAIRYTDLFIKGKLDIKENMLNFLPENLTYVNRSNRMYVLEDTERKIILTTSGMGSYGPAQVYIPEYITRKNALIHFTGYTAEGTLGSRLKNTPLGDTVEIGGLIARKLARVEYTTEYSAHAKANEMIEFLKQFRNLKLVLVNHGEAEVKNTFANRILKEVETKNVGLLGRDYFFRVSPYGLVKTLSTKFD